MTITAPNPDHVEAIVVGSGFGGAVLAARLAQAGVQVTVFERGRRWRPGTFPRSENIADGWLWNIGAGLYDIRWLDRMIGVQGAGWGGGSLIYANVFARPFEPSLSGRWPPHLRRDQLDEYYDLAAHMLDVQQAGPDPTTGHDAPRTAIVDGIIQRMGREAGTIRPNLAVRFSDPDAETLNRHGVPQRGCDFVGECVIGCNRGAKNTLDHNYLAVAERHGATAVTSAEVTRIDVHESGYLVTWVDPLHPEATPKTMTATRVFLAAGAVGTTELLLRQRDVFETLPLLSSRLGAEFSGNGDFLMTLRVRDAEGDLTRGPTITTTTILDVPERRTPVWFQLQDGGIPMPLQRLIDAALPLPRVRAALNSLRGALPTQRMSLLSMGRDSASGHLLLDRRGRATAHWDNRREARLYRAESRNGPLVSRMLRTRVVPSPTWTFLRRAITVHNLGGVPADRPELPGVVDQWGEVREYPGLFIVDGSTVPGSTGVNPSATILAAAERIAEHTVREITGDQQWRAPEWPNVTPTLVPEDVAAHAMAQHHARTSGDSVIFRERMTTPRASHKLGPEADLQLTVSFDGADVLFSDDEHRLKVNGSVAIAGVASGRPTQGTLSLFPNGEDIAMRYRLEFEDDEGKPWHLVGVKAFRRRGPIGKWHGVTQLWWEAEPVDGPPASRLRGIVSLGPIAVTRLLATIRGRGFTRLRRIAVIVRFAAFFATGALTTPVTAPE